MCIRDSIKSPYFMVPPESSWCLNRFTSLALRRQLYRLATDGVDDLVHTGHPCHAGKDNVHAGVVFLHRRGGTAVPHHDTVVILISGIPQAALDHTGSGISGE